MATITPTDYLECLKGLVSHATLTPLSAYYRVTLTGNYQVSIGGRMYVEIQFIDSGKKAFTLIQLLLK